MIKFLQKDLVKDVFFVLDSRVQYQEYQLKRLTKKAETLEQEGEKSYSNSIESLFRQIESHNHSLRLLKLLRSQLNIFNTSIVLDLVTDAKFLNFNYKELCRLLGLEEADIIAREKLLLF